jgi:sugar transferase (PEP-CTERM system associated)
MFGIRLRKKIILLSGDILLIIASTYLAVFFRQQAFRNVLNEYTGASIFIVLSYFMVFYIFDAYNLEKRYLSVTFLSQYIVAIVAGVMLATIAFYFFPPWKFGRGILLINAALITCGCFLWRILFQSIFPLGRKPKRIVILGAGQAGKYILERLNEMKDFSVVAVLDDDKDKWNKGINSHSVLGGSELIYDLVTKEGIDLVVVAITGEKQDKLLKTLLEVKTRGIEIYDIPTFYEENTQMLPVMHLRNGWVVYAPLSGLSSSSVYVSHAKRIIDVFLSLAGIMLLFPVAVIVAIAVKLDSKGTVLFKQERVGLRGNTFSLLKFRSMVMGAEENGQAVWAKENDSRATRVGKFIRRVHIDEIPQLWNVLKGEMTFIGPRPERPEFVKNLENEVPFYSLRHTVKPGLTGWAQVCYSYGASRTDSIGKLQYDLYYIKNLSFFLDLQILLKTIRVVLFAEGAR